MNIQISPSRSVCEALQRGVSIWTTTSLIVALLLSTVGCSSAESTVPAMPPRPTPVVDAVPVVSESIVEYREFTGRTAAVDSVEVRARVGGYLLQSPRVVPATGSTASSKSNERSISIPGGVQTGDFDVSVQEGDFVSAGTPLFEIDPAPYKLALEQARGSLESSKAQLRRADADLARAQDLFGSKSISKADLDLAVADRAQIAGQIVNLEATVQRAELDLSYTKVIAPISGLLGRTMMTEGNLVTADTTILTTIVAQDPIYANFDVDESSFLDYRRRMQNGDVQSPRSTAIAIELGLGNEKGFPHQGVIDFVDNQTDATTGNTRLRGRFNNDDGLLVPGLFARIRAPFTSEYTALLIPTQALGTDQQGRFVMVVDDQLKVHRRAVTVGAEQGDRSVIVQGLKDGELVVISGLQKIAEGATVKLSKSADTTPESAQENPVQPTEPPDSDAASTNQDAAEEETSADDAAQEEVAQ